LRMLGGSINPSVLQRIERRELIIQKLKECTSDLERLLGEEFLGLMLFGSWARDEAKEDSDVDIFVVLKSLKGIEIRLAIYKVVSGCLRRAVTLIDARPTSSSGRSWS